MGSISSYWNLRERNDRDLATLRELEDLGENVQPGSVVIADEHYGYLVPSVINARVVYFANEGNANPATPDLPERKRAVQAFFAGNRSAEVLERYVSDPAYVLVKKGDERRAPVNDLELLGTSLHFRLYRLDSG